MAKTSKIILATVLPIILLALVVYCVFYGKSTSESGVNTGSSTVVEALDKAEELAEAAERAYLNNTATLITLADDAGSASGPSVNIENNIVTITASGIYRLEGTLSEGQVRVEAEGSVTLILNGVNIYCSADAAINVIDAQQVLIYLPEGSENSLVSGTQQEISSADENSALTSAAGAAVYSKDDLSFAGTGSLTIGGYINNGVATTDRLTVLGGTLTIEAVNNGLKGKDSVLIVDGTVNITCGNDGIKSNNSTDENCGIVQIQSGTLNLFTLGDGIQAARDLTVADGTVNITAGNISESSTAQSMMQGGDMPENFEMPDIEMPEDGALEVPDGMPDMSQGDMPGFNTESSEMPEMPESGEMPDMPSGGMGGGTMTPPQMSEDGGTGTETGMEMPQMPDMDSESSTGLPEGNPAGTETDSEHLQTPGKGAAGFTGMGGFAGLFGNEQSGSSNTNSSAKGLKSKGDITVSGGTITVTSADDSLHADGIISVTGGSLTLASGDDGIHAEDSVTLEGADITITQSCEGVEAQLIYIKSGNISITASDDGINANGGTSMLGAMFFSGVSDSDTMPTLQISGGTLYVNAGGDGLDSNGDIIIDDGTVIVDGPSDSGNGALDSGSESGGTLLCNGGTVIAIGGSGMAESFESDSAQPSFIYNFRDTLTAGSEITITDSEGNIIFTHTAAKSFNSVVFSSPELEIGTSVTLTAGDETVEIEIDAITNGNSTGYSMSGFGGMGRN